MQAILNDTQRELIEANIEIPSRVCRMLIKRGGDAEEALGEAQMALVAAALSFEGQCEFPAFAFNKIKWHLLTWLRKQPRMLSLDQQLGDDSDGQTLGDVAAVDRNGLRPDQQLEYREKRSRIAATLREKGTIKLTEVRELTPTPAGLGPYYLRMREAVCESVTVADVQEIMAGLVAKAKKGDVRAANLVLQQVAGNSAPKVKMTVETRQVTMADFEPEE